MRTTRALALVVGLAAAGCLSACTLKPPPYAPIGDRMAYGYSDFVVPGGHSIRVVLPAYLQDPQMAYEFWDRRATELCGDQPYRKAIHTAIRPTVLYDHHGGRMGDYVLEGLAYCGHGAAEPASPPETAAS